METKSAILGRRSTRAFLPDAIHENVIRDILETARWAPSWGNAQDWNVYVLTGEPLERVKAEYLRKIREGEDEPTDLTMPARDRWPEHILARMNLTRPGDTFRPPPGPSIFEMYGAPCLLVFAIDDALVPEYACFDAGLLAENVCLAAEDVGLSSVIMAVSVRYPEVLRAVLPATRGKRFVIGVALGLAMRDAPANEIERRRVDLDEIVTWVG